MEEREAGRNKLEHGKWYGRSRARQLPGCVAGEDQGEGYRVTQEGLTEMTVF